MNDALQWVLSIKWNGWLALLLYWVPLSFCAFGYTLRTVRRTREDAKRRDECLASKNYYTPRETIGHLVGRALVTVLPVANVWAACFSLAPDVFGRFFEAIGKLFSQPLVPAHDDKKSA